MTEFPLTGGCNCGAVRFEVTAPLALASYCHCKRCQRRSGAAASANAHPAPDTFRIVAGEDKLRVWNGSRYRTMDYLVTTGVATRSADHRVQR
jgi:hypothetical protein